MGQKTKVAHYLCVSSLDRLFLVLAVRLLSAVVAGALVDVFRSIVVTKIPSSVEFITIERSCVSATASPEKSHRKKGSPAFSLAA
jgi:hypothetical protein